MVRALAAVLLAGHHLRRDGTGRVHDEHSLFLSFDRRRRGRRDHFGHHDLNAGDDHRDHGVARAAVRGAAVARAAARTLPRFRTARHMRVGAADGRRNTAGWVALRSRWDAKGAHILAAVLRATARVAGEEMPQQLGYPQDRRYMDLAPRLCRGFDESAFRDPDGMDVYVRSFKKLR